MIRTLSILLLLTAPLANAYPSKMTGDTCTYAKFAIGQMVRGNISRVLYLVCKNL